MGNRSRVISFISNFSTGSRDSRANPITPSHPHPKSEPQETGSSPANQSSPDLSIITTGAPQQNAQQLRAYPSSKPASILYQSCQPQMIDVDQNTLPELQPIFTLLNDHANKLYQEGYFLKLDDQNTQGKPNPDRVWIECFAQLVGTVLSLWDAAELDLAGQEGEVLPKFINLSDASIKMIESLPTRSQTDAPLQNVLSISTAGKNRYLLHFNSHHSLIQWTAGIRLAMYEHATLQEAYTGALIAGKGKCLNNINAIMDRSKSPTADWARVRFGAGTPWRRCWCVISPADEKEVIKLHKQWKKSPYDRSRPPILKGVIKFYHSKKTKKVQPIATISDAFSAFAIYPQSKPLIDASTLVKVEGSIIIHSTPPSTTEGFVFVMPEVHPAVTGFEMMLRWLFPVFDTFGLYGRPGRLVAATEDVRSLMFAMPTQRRHGYLETLDVIGLILEEGSTNWKESQWRKKMKELTSKRMMTIESDIRTDSRIGSRRGARSSMGPGQFRSVKFDTEGDNASVRSTPSTPWALKSNLDGNHYGNGVRTDSSPLTSLQLQTQANDTHQSLSETQATNRLLTSTPLSIRITTNEELPLPQNATNNSSLKPKSEFEATQERLSSEDEQPIEVTHVNELQEFNLNVSPEPVSAPPAFVHGPGSLPLSKPYHSPELRRANSRISSTTLNHLTNANSTSAESTSSDERRTKIGLNIVEDKYSSKINNYHPTNDLGCRDNLNINKFLNKKKSYDRLANSGNGILSSNVGSSDKKFSMNSSTSMQHAQIKNLTSNSAYQVRRKIDSIGDSTSVLPDEPMQKTLINIPRASDVDTPILDKVGSDPIQTDGYFISNDVFDKISIETSRLCAEAIKKSSSNNDHDKSILDPDRSKKSIEIFRNLDKPRAGVMRTVGDTRLENNGKTLDKTNFDIDFGPTFNYATSKSSGFLNGLLGSNNLKSNLSEYTLQQDSPMLASNIRGNSESSDSRTDGSERSATDSRKLAWNPIFAGFVNTTTQQKSITPRDFVAQRTNMASKYGHHRLPSGDALRSAMKTPPLNGNRIFEKSSTVLHSRNYSLDPSLLTNHSRKFSGDLLQRPTSRSAARALGSPVLSSNPQIDNSPRINHSASASSDLIQRPRSRAASIILNSTSNGNVNVASHLTAREQEHLAKVTGQPLISIATNGRNLPSAGLVAALEAREKDKNTVRQVVNSRAVEQVIQNRQQAQFPAPNMFMQSGKVWPVSDSSNTTNFEHGRMLSSLSASEFHPQSRYLGREGIKFA